MLGRSIILCSIRLDLIPKLVPWLENFQTLKSRPKPIISWILLTFAAFVFVLSFEFKIVWCNCIFQISTNQGQRQSVGYFPLWPQFLTECLQLCLPCRFKEFCTGCQPFLFYWQIDFDLRFSWQWGPDWIEEMRIAQMILAHMGHGHCDAISTCISITDTGACGNICEIDTMCTSQAMLEALHIKKFLASFLVQHWSGLLLVNQRQKKRSAHEGDARHT